MKKNTLRKQHASKYGENFNKSSKRYLVRKQDDRQARALIREYLY